MIYHKSNDVEFLWELEVIQPPVRKRFSNSEIIKLLS